MKGEEGDCVRSDREEGVAVEASKYITETLFFSVYSYPTQTLAEYVRREWLVSLCDAM